VRDHDADRLKRKTADAEGMVDLSGKVIQSLVKFEYVDITFNFDVSSHTKLRVLSLSLRSSPTQHALTLLEYRVLCLVSPLNPLLLFSLALRILFTDSLTRDPSSPSLLDGTLALMLVPSSPDIKPSNILCNSQGDTRATLSCVILAQLIDSTANTFVGIGVVM
jgi:hypothetical protein